MLTTNGNLNVVNRNQLFKIKQWRLKLLRRSSFLEVKCHGNKIRDIKYLLRRNTRSIIKNGEVLS